MPRDLSTLRVLRTAEDVVACLREDPLDRVFLYGNDLTADEFTDYGMAVRTDDSIMVVRSMRAVGATNVTEFVRITGREGYPDGPRVGEIAIVGDGSERDRSGRVVPDDIRRLQCDAEEKVAGRALSWAKYEGLCVLADHPEAEQGVGIPD